MSANQRDLTLKQERWLNAYLETGNATEAARIAGYKGDDNQLGVVGAQNLRKLRIREQIEERILDAGISAKEVVGTLASHARIDATEAYKPGQNGLIDRCRDKGIGHWIKSITIKRHVEGKGEEAIEVEVERVEFHSSFSALTQLSKILGIEKAPLENSDRTEVAITTTMANLNMSRDEAITWLAADPKTSDIVRNVRASQS